MEPIYTRVRNLLDDKGFISAAFTLQTLKKDDEGMIVTMMDGNMDHMLKGKKKGKEAPQLRGIVENIETSNINGAVKMTETFFSANARMVNYARKLEDWIDQNSAEFNEENIVEFCRRIMTTTVSPDVFCKLKFPGIAKADG